MEPRQFKQKRSAETYERLLAAAAKVFAENGFDGAQTPDIAAAAGVSTGAFYRYFEDKRQIFLELLAVHLEKERALVQAKLSADRFVGEGTEAAIDLVLDVLFESLAKNPALHRVYLGASLVDPEVAAVRAAAEAEDRAILTRLIAALAPKECIPRAEAAALVVQIAALEVAAERAGLRPKTGPRIPDQEVKRALRDMLHRYLFATRPKKVK